MNNNYSKRTRSGILGILKTGLAFGLKKGWKNFIWMVKITVPVSLVVALLQWSGWLYKADFIFEPLMNLLQLPAQAIFPILSGLFINIYAVVAVLAVVPFSSGQMIMIAVFTLIAHNIIIEALIQHRSGINAFKISGIRILAAVITVWAISFFMDNTRENVSPVMINDGALVLSEAIIVWLRDTGWLLLRMLIIILGIMILLECLTRLELDRYLYRVFRPFMKILGLSDRSVVLWVTAVVFGVMYGSAVIHEKANEGNLAKDELERIHISIGINHSMLEDPALFIAIGLNGFWLIIPRLLTAVLFVQSDRLIGKIRKKWPKVK